MTNATSNIEVQEVRIGNVVDLPPVALRRETAARFVGISAGTLDRWRAAGRFPKPIVEELDRNGTPRMTLWLAEHLRAWALAGMPSGWGPESMRDGVAGRGATKGKGAASVRR
ncbi:MAG: hypothetical protein U0575_07355 [Phycisphaerales bacterium]